MAGPTLVWLRDDLRLADNPALTAAVSRGHGVVVVFVLDDESPGIRPIGSASRWWLHHSLAALDASLDGMLVLRRGPAERVIPALVDELGATAVYWNRRYSAAREIDARIKTSLRDAGVEVESFQANLLFEPWTVQTGDGGPYKVFTPFWRACLERGGVREPLGVPDLGAVLGAPGSESLDGWGLLPTTPDWAGGLRDTWTPGERGAHDRLDAFMGGALSRYHRRDEPAVEATSRLSPHLRFGEVSPFQVWDRVHGVSANSAKFLSEVGWREFSWHILFHWPRLATENFRPAFDAFGWGHPGDEVLAAWRHGRTGIPLVDAGMRELWHTGYMHNRVRMVVASFLIKNLLVDWRVGEEWFWDTLVDADEANNPASWQWVAGSGADAAPYFRVFNPELQAKKFDPDAEYIRRWVPEYGTPDYPDPIVDLARSRQEALDAYEAVKAAAASRG
ncbi:cryptochrome/photolyase family protein [Salinibacterium soli]|uniref:Deoxyribodipyrimidine photo-lyase n=1 Tax=Antiquaquibacter soli TaxID=3064523 RepID=A0ABT9BM34_9MICO|nr:deoxyribodipyrimidine photo-lyase [Protaetiibacter sp. WY-16]MDO7880841.1 deoxyribodipyrimidine photo-lyase [Protaetiibacter sp. WY-16]